MFQRLGLPVAAAWAMRHLGRCVLELGDVARAEALLQEALRIAMAQVRPDVPLVLQAIAELEVRRGSLERASTLSGAAEATRKQMGLKLPPREQAAAGAATDELRTQLGDERFEDLAERGSAMTLEEACAQAGEW
jgi:hypothetical protein